MEIRGDKLREPKYKDVTRRGLMSYTESKLHPFLFGNTIYREKHNTNVDVRTDTSLLRRVCFVTILTVIFVPEIPNWYSPIQSLAPCMFFLLFGDTWLPVFIFHKSWIQVNYFLCSVTKWFSVPPEKLELIMDIRDIISYFSLKIFSFKTSGR